MCRSYFADAVSGNHMLEDTHFEEMHTYRLDWQPFEGENGEKPYLRWYLDDEQLYGIGADTLVRLRWVGLGGAGLGGAVLGTTGEGREGGGVVARNVPVWVNLSTKYG